MSSQALAAGDFMILNPDSSQGQVTRARKAPLLPPALDTANYFMVGVKGDEVVILRPKSGPMTKAEAANLAKWLFVLSGESVDAFARGVKEIQKS
jgi:hypothetical protein